MSQTTVMNDLVRLSDLEWLDLSDLIRIDDEWRRTVVTVTRANALVTLGLALVVIAFALLARPISFADSTAVGWMLLSAAGMGYLLWRAGTSEARVLAQLPYVVALNIAAISLMVFVLRDLPGDYYLLYFLPLVSAAGYLGLRSALAGLASASAYALIFAVSQTTPGDAAWSALVPRALVFILIAALIGVIAERHLRLLAALRASHRQALYLAVTDTKTGLFNQRFLESRLKSEMARAQRSKTPVAFLVVDVNGLERINRAHGFSAGDAVLRTLGAVVQKQLRATDLASRWGVDEIALLLYNSDAAGAAIVARRIAADLARQSFGDPATGKSFGVTVAQGIASFPEHTVDASGAALVERAYAALRRAQERQEGVVVG